MCPFAHTVRPKKKNFFIKGRLGGAGAFSQIFPKLKNKNHFTIILPIILQHLYKPHHITWMYLQLVYLLTIMDCGHLV